MDFLPYEYPSNLLLLAFDFFYQLFIFMIFCLQSENLKTKTNGKLVQKECLPKWMSYKLSYLSSVTKKYLW